MNTDEHGSTAGAGPEKRSRVEPRAGDLLDAISMSIDDEQTLRASLETLQAITLLEYHDSNWLAGDPKQRNEAKQEIINNILRIIGTSAKNTFG